MLVTSRFFRARPWRRPRRRCERFAGISWRKLRFRFDWTLTFATLAIVAVGLVNLWSALQDRGPHLFSKQVSLFGVGFCVFLAVATFDYRTISRLGYILYGGGVTLLVAVLVFGRVVGGARRWFDLGPIHVQPSGDHAAADYLGAREVPERLARAGRQDVSAPRDSGGDRQRSDPAGRPAAGSGNRVYDISDLHHHHADRAPEAEDAGRDLGTGRHIGVADLALWPARIPAQARGGAAESTRRRGLAVAPGAERHRIGAFPWARGSCRRHKFGFAAFRPCGPIFRSPCGPRSGASSGA